MWYDMEFQELGPFGRTTAQRLVSAGICIVTIHDIAEMRYGPFPKIH